MALFEWYGEHGGYLSPGAAVEQQVIPPVSPPLRQFKAGYCEGGFGSGTLAVEQAIERTTANIKWLTENKKAVQDWFKAEAVAA